MIRGWKSIVSAAVCCILLLQSTVFVFADGPGGTPPGAPPGGSTGETTTETVSLIINQVYGGESSPSAVFNRSFIELFNDSGEDISLSDFTLTYDSANDSADKATLTMSGTVPPHTSYLVRCGATGNTNAQYGVYTSDIIWDQTISAESYQIAVYDDSDNLLDAVAVGSSTTYTLAEGTAITGVSVSSAIRRKDFADTDNNADDFEIIDYSESDNYEQFRPHSTEDGSWTFLKDFTINIGSDEKSIGVAWFSTTAGGTFQIMKGSSFDAAIAVSYAADTEVSYEEGCYSNHVVFDGLESNTTYAYRYGNCGVWSAADTYTTPNLDSDSFSFVAMGDPQIGASGDADSDAEGWSNAVNDALKDNNESGFSANFILSVGDQINQSSTTETLASEYSGFFGADALTSVPFVATVGNHDSSTTLFNEHYNLPNVSEDYGSSGDGAAEGDYYFNYGNTLFMVLNTNNSSIAEHTAFMKQAIDKAGDSSAWKVVVFHQSIYSVASHVNDGNIAALRQGLSPVLYNLDIDVVLMGHDHVYARSYIMGETQNAYGSEAVDTEVTDSVTNPDGVLYLTLNSSSGSKYYGITSELYEYTAVMNQSKQQTYSDVTVTPTSFNITTYYLSGGVVDDYTIYKNGSEYVDGYSADYTDDTLSINSSSYRSTLLTNNTGGLDPTKNAARTNGETYTLLPVIDDTATGITFTASADGDYYAYPRIYDASGVRCGGNLGWIKPGDELTIDLTSSIYSTAAYYSVVVKKGLDGSSLIEGAAADYITVEIEQRDPDVSFGTKTSAVCGTYTYVNVSDRTPYVYTPTGAGSSTSSDFTNVLGMAEEYGEDNGIIVAINSGIFYNWGTTEQYCFNYKEADGVVISNGVVLKSTESIDHTECDILVIDSDGNVGWAPYYADADGLAAGTETWYDIYGNETTGKIVSAVTGFVPVLVNSATVYDAADSAGTYGYDNYVGHYTQSAVRQIFGVKADGTDVILSGTWTLATAASAALEEGCVFAYNLDGGGSAETVIGGSNTVIGNSDNADDYYAYDLVEQSKGTRPLPTYIVFTASDEAPVSADADTISAEISETSYKTTVELEDLIENLTVTESYKNANGNTSSRTIYSRQGIDTSATLTNVVLGGATTLDTCTVRKTSTAPNGTLYYTKSDSDITTSLKNNSNTRQSENYYDYSTGYTLFTGDDLTTKGTKTITVSYSPGGGLAALTDTFEITVSSAAVTTGGTSSSSSGTSKKTYSVAVTQGSNGTISPSTISVSSGDSKTFTITPNENYEISDVLVDGASVGAVGSYTFDNVTATHTITAAFTEKEAEEATETPPSEPQFTDVGASDWFAEAVEYCVGLGLFKGTSDTAFSPSETMTREMFATVLYRLAGQPESTGTNKFKDVSDSSAYFHDAVAWASESGIVAGYSDEIFGAGDSVSREQIVVMLYRYDVKFGGGGLTGTHGGDISSYTDFAEISDYARDAFSWALSVGIIEGTSEATLSPGTEATRAEVAAILMRACQS